MVRRAELFRAPGPRGLRTVAKLLLRAERSEATVHIVGGLATFFGRSRGKWIEATGHFENEGSSVIAVADSARILDRPLPPVRECHLTGLMSLTETTRGTSWSLRLSDGRAELTGVVSRETKAQPVQGVVSVVADFATTGRGVALQRARIEVLDPLEKEKEEEDGAVVDGDIIADVDDTGEKK